MCLTSKTSFPSIRMTGMVSQYLSWSSGSSPMSTTLTSRLNFVESEFNVATTFSHKWQPFFETTVTARRIGRRASGAHLYFVLPGCEPLWRGVGAWRGLSRFLGELPLRYQDPDPLLACDGPVA